ncbi:MAG: hypothetical protein P8P48_07720 [Saprospiraceae bacterium]|nr:hypothetical protein [Saprospiraceae bacterium]
MRTMLKNIFLPILVVTICYSQIGVLMYEVYCHCKKEASYHLHLAVNECSESHVLAADKVSCCSANKCALPDKENKPCSEKDIKLLKLEIAKNLVENNFELDDFNYSGSAFLIFNNSIQTQIRSCIHANAPPNTELKKSVFARYTLPFIQSFLC